MPIEVPRGVVGLASLVSSCFLMKVAYFSARNSRRFFSSSDCKSKPVLKPPVGLRYLLRS